VLADLDCLLDVLSFLFLGGNIEFLDLGLIFCDSLGKSLSFSGSSLRSNELSSSQSLGIRIQLNHKSQIFQGIFLVNDILLGLNLSAEMRLDLL